MNQAIKERWVQALKSGEYEQAPYQLHGEKGYCCLGVLCDLFLKDHQEEWTADGDEVYSMDEMCQYLPERVVTWAGLNTDNPCVRTRKEIVPLSSLNDTLLPFNSIADLIQKQL